MGEFIPTMGGNAPAMAKGASGWPLDVIGNITVPNEVITILCRADVAGNIDGKYFTISSRTTNYKVWFNVDSGGNAPAAGGATLVPIAVTTNDTAATIATAVNTALNGLEGILSTRDTATLTVTFQGDVTQAADVDSGVTITVVTQGKSAVIGTTIGNLRGLAFQGAAQNAAANGAVVIPVTTLFTGLITNATGAIAASLADGLAAGQMKIVKLETKDTNNAVLTPANLKGGSTLTFDATGEIAIMVWDGDEWTVVYTNATLG